MHLGRAIVTAIASLAARQTLDSVIPNGYCKPQCPQCKNAVTDPFDYTTACQPNSSFLTNCGSCQTCIWTYALENPDLPDMSFPENGIQTLLNLCLNTTGNDEVVALQSQVSRISQLGDVLNSGHTPTTTYSEITITRTGVSRTYTITETANPSWTTIHTTTTPASYLSHTKSMASTAASVIPNSSTIGLASTITAAPILPTSLSPSTHADDQPLDKSWVIGPIVGSVSGIAVILIVIFLMRRKQRLDAQAIEAAKDTKEIDDESSRGSTLGQWPFYSGSVVMGELENNEVHELPAMEPVGSELGTPRDGKMDSHEDWPMPLSPLPLLFAMTELRDERTGNNHSPKHETYYHS